MTKYLKNFNAMEAELIRSAPTAKAAMFAQRVADQCRARGHIWIEKNAAALGVLFTPEIPTSSAEYSAAIAPVADNRAYHIGRWQAVLMGL